jgi:hypothetical protein
MSVRKPFRAEPVQIGEYYRRKKRLARFQAVRSYGLILLAALATFTGVNRR